MLTTCFTEEEKRSLALLSLFGTPFIFNQISFDIFVEVPLIIISAKVSEDKDQELIQSSSTPNPEHQMWEWQKHNKTLNTREPWGQPFPSRWLQGCNEQTKSMTDKKHK